MAVREIRLYGDPVLNSKCDPIADFGDKTISLIEDLLETTKVPGRAGVAAPQIGVSLQAFSFNVNGNIGYLINPHNLVLEGEPEMLEEGCLSVPGLWHKTLRYPKATLTGSLLDQSVTTITGTELLAQALQHEYDHLQGVLYIARLGAEERRLAMKELRASDWFLS
jgi:peptide deformylase